MRNKTATGKQKKTGPMEDWKAVDLLIADAKEKGQAIQEIHWTHCYHGTGFFKAGCTYVVGIYGGLMHKIEVIDTPRGPELFPPSTSKERLAGR